VEDYGWALSGRNTIDLYMATSREMNGWGVRQELIQIVHWGDPQESLRRLARHTKYRHIKRMVLELEGHERAAQIWINVGGACVPRPSGQHGQSPHTGGSHIAPRSRSIHLW
jgi:hypothetical protein